MAENKVRIDPEALLAGVQQEQEYYSPLAGNPFLMMGNPNLFDMASMRYPITAEGAANYAKGLVSGTAGIPGDMAGMMNAAAQVSRGTPLPVADYTTPIGTDAIGQAMGADVESPGFVAGSFGIPGAEDLVKLGAIAKAAAMVGKVTKNEGKAETIGDVLNAGRRVDAPGVRPEDVNMDNLDAFMTANGLPGAGKLSKIETVEGQGVSVEIPGGLEGDFTYADLMWLKANPIDASTLPRDMHSRLQMKLSRATDPKGHGLDHDRVETFNRYIFGMLSPNQPLTPNEFEFSILRARSEDDIDKLASYIDWEPGDVVDDVKRKAINDKMARDFGTQAKSKGGMGLKGSADYTNLAELAKLYKKDPDFFVKAPDESWANFNERVMTQARGLSSKVAAFSTVWQDPITAAISAVDRHMAREFMPKLFGSNKKRKEWENGVVNRWNDLVRKRADLDARSNAVYEPIQAKWDARQQRLLDIKNWSRQQLKQLKENGDIDAAEWRERGKKVTAGYNDAIKRERAAFNDEMSSARAQFKDERDLLPKGDALVEAKNLDDVLAQQGGEAVFMDRIMSLLGGMEPKFRLKSGEINPNVPQHLRETNWIVEPETARTMSDAYKRAQAHNDALAQEHGLGLFSSQWMEWDRIRRRLEPHEVMYPGLHRLPPMPKERTRAALAEHKEAGYLNSSKTPYLNPDTGEVDMRLNPTRPMDINKALYWSSPAATATIGGLLMAGKDDQK